VAALCIGFAVSPHVAAAQTTQTITLRGRPQQLRIYGQRGSGIPVIVSSGDGGWMHLGPHVAQVLAANGYFVVGFDTKRYLESFTDANSTLSPSDAPRDYKALVDFSGQGFTSKPILIGVSEGAGLSLLAATDQQTKRAIGGVVAIGLPNRNELGWRWKDSLIYLTHKVPNEPTFSAEAIAGSVTPVPLAAIHSTEDEFVSVTEVTKVLKAANEPKRLWIVTAHDHRFSDNLQEFDRRLLEALEWARNNQPR
jgi:alpha-beta hydrolase superfamily lysophospholipase